MSEGVQFDPKISSNSIHTPLSLSFFFLRFGWGRFLLRFMYLALFPFVPPSRDRHTRLGMSQNKDQKCKKKKKNAQITSHLYHLNILS